MNLIPRSEYMARLRQWKDRDVIKVVTGVRRCGKSTLLAMFARELAENGVPQNRIISINLEQLENEHLLNYRALHDEVMDRADPNGMNYVFIDEVQNVEGFQKAVDSLYTRDNIDLYITGSNALLLSGTLATLLSGRYVEVSMLPLSFGEYASAFPGMSLARLYSRYIRQGGFPAAVDLESDSLALHDYLEGILNTVLFKDVAQRISVGNTSVLEAVSNFMFDNIANLTSSKKISDALTSQGTKVARNTVAHYLSALANSYFFYPAKRFDVRGKHLLKLQEKYYAVDMGLRRTALSGQVRDTGRILENVVFLELLRRYGTVYTGRIDDAEVDFVVTGPEGLSYFQVAETVVGEKTLARELRSLKAIDDNYPKYLLTMDDCDPVSHDGIVQKNALDWLVETANTEAGTNA